MTYTFKFQVPGTILCDVGQVERIGSEMKKLGSFRVLLVTDEDVRGAGLVERVIDGTSADEVEVVGVFDGIPSNSSVETIEDCCSAMDDLGADGLVSVGGGSVIDTAKASLIKICEGGDLREFQGNSYRPSEPLLPHIAVPTTAGTGSESTYIALVTDRETNRKMLFHGKALAPRVAVLDPMMTVTLPGELTASTGIDALTHAIEALHSNMSEPITESLATRAIELIAGNLQRAYLEGGDVEARSNMQLAANMAGIAASNAFVGIVHAMSHAVGGLFDVPHGVATAILLPHGMEFSLPFGDVANQYRKVAVALGLVVEGDDDHTAARKAIETVRGIIRELGLTRKLGDAGVTRESIPDLVSETMVDSAMYITPGSPSAEQVRAVFETAL